MQRIILIVVVLWAVWKLLSLWGRRSAGAGADEFSRFSSRSRQRRQRERDEDASDDLIACQVCGTNVPVDRTMLAAGGRRVCSTECLERLDSGR